MPRIGKPDTWHRQTNIQCCRKKECPGYDPNASIPRPTKLTVLSVLRRELYCADCQNVFCAVCKDQHTAEACQAMAKGFITKEDLIAALAREPSKKGQTHPKRSTAQPSILTTAEPSASAHADVPVAADHSVDHSQLLTEQDVPSSSQGPPAVAQDSSRPSARASRWNRASRIPCCMKRQCCGYDPSIPVPYQNREKITDILKLQLLCKRCHNIFCTGCMQQHTAAACEAMEPGDITEQDLIAAAARPGGRGSMTDSQQQGDFEPSKTVADKPGAGTQAAGTLAAGTTAVAQAVGTAAAAGSTGQAAGVPGKRSEGGTDANKVFLQQGKRPKTSLLEEKAASKSIKLYDVNESSDRGRHVYLFEDLMPARVGPGSAHWPRASGQQRRQWQQWLQRPGPADTAVMPAAAVSVDVTAAATNPPAALQQQQKKRGRGRPRKNQSSMPAPQQQQQQANEPAGSSGKVAAQRQRKRQHRQLISSSSSDDEDHVPLSNRQLSGGGYSTGQRDPGAAGGCDGGHKQQQAEKEQQQPRKRGRPRKDGSSQPAGQHPPQQQHQQQEEVSGQPAGKGQGQQRQQQQDDESSEDPDAEIPLALRMTSLDGPVKQQQQKQQHAGSAGTRPPRQQQQQVTASGQQLNTPFADAQETAAAGTSKHALQPQRNSLSGASNGSRQQQQLQRQGSSRPFGSGSLPATGSAPKVKYPLVDHMQLAGCVTQLPPLAHGEVRALGQTMHPSIVRRHQQIDAHFWQDYESSAVAAQAAYSIRSTNLEALLSTMSSQHVSLHAPWTDAAAAEHSNQWFKEHKMKPKGLQQQLVDLIQAQMCVEFGPGCALAAERRLPEDLPTRFMEVYDVPQDHPLELLRGQKSVRATEDLTPGTILGPYSGYMLLDDQYSELRLNKPTKFSSGDRARDKFLWELCMESYAVQDENYHLPQFDAQAVAAPRPVGRPPKAAAAAGSKYIKHIPVFTSAFGYGNATAAVNDPTVDPFMDDLYDGTMAWDEREVVSAPNVIIRVLWVRNWPYLFMITCRDVKAGEDFWYDYTQPYWSILRDLLRRIMDGTDLQTHQHVFSSAYDLCRGNGAAVAALVERITGRPQHVPQGSQPTSMMSAERLATAANLPAELSVAPSHTLQPTAPPAAAGGLPWPGSNDAIDAAATAAAVPGDAVMAALQAAVDGQVEGPGPAQLGTQPATGVCVRDSSSPEADDKGLSAQSPLLQSLATGAGAAARGFAGASTAAAGAATKQPSSLEAAWLNIKAAAAAPAAAVGVLSEADDVSMNSTSSGEVVPDKAAAAGTRDSSGPPRVPAEETAVVQLAQQTSVPSPPPPLPPPPPPPPPPAPAAESMPVACQGSYQQKPMAAAAAQQQRAAVQPPPPPKQQQQQQQPQHLKPPASPAAANSSRPGGGIGGAGGASGRSISPFAAAAARSGKPALRRGSDPARSGAARYSRSTSRSRSPRSRSLKCTKLRRGDATTPDHRDSKGSKHWTSPRSRSRSRSRNRGSRRSRSRDRYGSGSGRHRSRSRDRNGYNNWGDRNVLMWRSRSRSKSRNRYSTYRNSSSRARSRSRSRTRSNSRDRKRRTSSRSRERCRSSATAAPAAPAATAAAGAARGGLQSPVKQGLRRGSGQQVAGDAIAKEPSLPTGQQPTSAVATPAPQRQPVAMQRSSATEQQTSAQAQDEDICPTVANPGVAAEQPEPMRPSRVAHARPPGRAAAAKARPSPDGDVVLLSSPSSSSSITISSGGDDADLASSPLGDLHKVPGSSAVPAAAAAAGEAGGAAAAVWGTVAAINSAASAGAGSQLPLQPQASVAATTPVAAVTRAPSSVFMRLQQQQPKQQKPQITTAGGLSQQQQRRVSDPSAAVSLSSQGHYPSSVLMRWRQQQQQKMKEQRDQAGPSAAPQPAPAEAHRTPPAPAPTQGCNVFPQGVSWRNLPEFVGIDVLTEVHNAVAVPANAVGAAETFAAPPATHQHCATTAANARQPEQQQQQGRGVQQPEAAASQPHQRHMAAQQVERSSDVQQQQQQHSSQCGQQLTSPAAQAGQPAQPPPPAAAAAAIRQPDNGVGHGEVPKGPAAATKQPPASSTAAAARPAAVNRLPTVARKNTSQQERRRPDKPQSPAEGISPGQPLGQQAAKHLAPAPEPAEFVAAGLVSGVLAHDTVAAAAIEATPGGNSSSLAPKAQRHTATPTTGEGSGSAPPQAAAAAANQAHIKQGAMPATHGTANTAKQTQAGRVAPAPQPGAAPAGRQHTGVRVQPMTAKSSPAASAPVVGGLPTSRGTLAGTGGQSVVQLQVGKPKPQQPAGSAPATGGVSNTKSQPSAGSAGILGGAAAVPFQIAAAAPAKGHIQRQPAGSRPVQGVQQTPVTSQHNPPQQLRLPMLGPGRPPGASAGQTAAFVLPGLAPAPPGVPQPKVIPGIGVASVNAGRGQGAASAPRMQQTPAAERSAAIAPPAVGSVGGGTPTADAAVAQVAAAAAAAAPDAADADFDQACVPTFPVGNLLVYTSGDEDDDSDDDD